jgi:phosphatidylserine/phosphatidylglycerophosphate/cardiolipin synthase-like enzyme
MVDILLGTLGTSGADLRLVSPWITDFDISLRNRGTLAPHFGAGVESIRLSSLVELIQKTNRFSIVVRPPHVLFGRGELARLAEIQTTRSSLALLADDPAVRTALGLLEREASRLAENIMTHRETLRFIRSVAHLPNVALIFNPNLHAKVLSTSKAAMVGSANFTWSGMNRNDELTLLFADAGTVAKLGAVAAGFGARWFATRAEDYDFRKVLAAPEAAALDQLLVDSLSTAELRHFLADCAAL